MQKQSIGNPDTAYIFDVGDGKVNKSIKYASKDNPSKTKVLSHEPYAQELYERYIRHFENLVGSESLSKDLNVGETYEVILTNVDFQDKVIRSEIIGSGTPIFIPFSEFHLDKNDIVGQEYTIIVYNNLNGVYYGSFKRYAQIDYLQEVVDAANTNNFFYVKVKSLIDGGYIAEYKDTVQCFLPGGQAAANILRNFDDLIGTTIPVMVDSYDASSKLYIVSHKRYIRHVLPIKIKDLKFDKLYKGTLTSKPTNFGLFVEINNFFTGLVHKTEFVDYHDMQQEMKAFDEIDVYVKDVILDKNGKYKIILTTDPTSVNRRKTKYSMLDSKYRNKILNYTYHSEKNTLTIKTEDGDITIPVLPSYVEKFINFGYKHIVIRDVDVIKERVFFDFMR